MDLASLPASLRARRGFRGIQRRSRHPISSLEQRRWWFDGQIVGPVTPIQCRWPSERGVKIRGRRSPNPKPLPRTQGRFPFPPSTSSGTIGGKNSCCIPFRHHQTRSRGVPSPTARKNFLEVVELHKIGPRAPSHFRPICELFFSRTEKG